MIDSDYVGQPPAIEVTVVNLNDNIDKQFLSSMLDKCGTFDEIQIYHHPVTNKHLGIARIVFESTKGARQFVEKYNEKSVMGKVCFIGCFLVLLCLLLRSFFFAVTIYRGIRIHMRVI